MTDEKDNIVDFNKEKLLKQISEYTGFDKKNSDIESALEGAIKRANLYESYDVVKEGELKKRGINPLECHNEVCNHNIDMVCNNQHGKPVSCMYRMITEPPLEMEYKEYMPSHQEALDILVENGLLDGEGTE